MSVRSVKPGRQRPQCLVMDTAQMGRCDRAGTRWIPAGELPPERPDGQVTRKPGVSRGPRQPPAGGRPAGLTRQRQATRRPKTVRGRRAGRTMSCMLTRNGRRTAICRSPSSAGRQCRARRHTALRAAARSWRGSEVSPPPSDVQPPGLPTGRSDGLRPSALSVLRANTTADTATSPIRTANTSDRREHLSPSSSRERIERRAQRLGRS